MIAVLISNVKLKRHSLSTVPILHLRPRLSIRVEINLQAGYRSSAHSPGAKCAGKGFLSASWAHPVGEILRYTLAYHGDLVL
jgi:hypothetical protein